MTPHVIDSKTYVKAEYHADLHECNHVDCTNKMRVDQMYALVAGDQENHGVYLFCSYECYLECACTRGTA